MAENAAEIKSLITHIDTTNENLSGRAGLALISLNILLSLILSFFFSPAVQCCRADVVSPAILLTAESAASPLF